MRWASTISSISGRRPRWSSTPSVSSSVRAFTWTSVGRRSRMSPGGARTARSRPSASSRQRSTGWPAGSSRPSTRTVHPRARSWRRCLRCDLGVPAAAPPGRRIAIMVFSHYPPVDELAAERLRAATVAWAPLLGELHAAGFRPYLELEMAESDDPLRVFCELDTRRCWISRSAMRASPDAPVVVPESDWVVFVQSASGGYLAEVYIEATVDFQELASRLRDLVDSVAAGEHPFLVDQ